MTQNEHDLEQKLIRKAKAYGGWAPKFLSPGHSGMPDRIVLLPGRYVCFAELKAPGKIPRELQIAQQEKLRKLGFRVYGCVDSEEKINRIFAEYERERTMDKTKVLVNSEEVVVDGKPKIDNFGDTIIARHIKAAEIEDFLNGYTLIGVQPTWDGEPVEFRDGDRENLLFDGMAYTYMNPDVHATSRRKILFTQFDDPWDGFILVESR